MYTKSVEVKFRSERNLNVSCAYMKESLTRLLEIKGLFKATFDYANSLQKIMVGWKILFKVPCGKVSFRISEKRVLLYGL